MAQDWRHRFTDGGLAAVSRILMLRDWLLGTTRKLRRHPLAQEITFASGERSLSAVFVPGEPGVPVLLLCHGIGETVEHWSAAQALLRDHGIGSLIFNYSGYARSTGRLRAQHCDEDFLAAYVELRKRVSTDLPVFVLGFSLGSGIAAQGFPSLQPKPAGLFLCEAFPTFREAVHAAGMPSWLANLVVAPLWQTSDAMQHAEPPVWIVHSDGDRLFPVSMARKLVAASGATADFVLIEGLAHNEPFLKAVDRYWQPIIETVLAARP